MTSFKITIDHQEVEVREGQSVLDAARSLGLDIPTLCYLERCGPATSCLVCLVKINGRLVPSCGAKVAPGMVVQSETDEVREARRTALELLFSDHVGDCLSPCHRLCPLQLNIPVMIRHLQAGELSDAVATVRQALPLASVLGRLCNHPCEQGCRRGSEDLPAAIREMERFVADHDLHLPDAFRIPCKPSTGRSVAIVGAGPCGLSAAFYLARQGHTVTVLDRNERSGGTLRRLGDAELPKSILDAELARLASLGIRFRNKVELGTGTTLPELLREFHAVLLATGEFSTNTDPDLGIVRAGPGIPADAATCQTNVPGVFAAGSAVKSAKLLVRAMAEGKAAAECLDRFLAGEPVRRSQKPFSSVMGRIEPAELQLFLQSAGAAPRHEPCDACAGFSHGEATGEAGRCLRCDCRSAGNCAFQHYAQVYGANAGRFRTGQRPPFEQQAQPGGVIFEPGKCILCGICVRLTEMAREPLGLTFIGRGFEVRIATPFNKTIEEGMQKVAEECVQHCPTGALAMRDKGFLPTARTIDFWT